MEAYFIFPYFHATKSCYRSVISETSVEYDVNPSNKIMLYKCIVSTLKIDALSKCQILWTRMRNPFTRRLIRIQVVYIWYYGLRKADLFSVSSDCNMSTYIPTFANSRLRVIPILRSLWQERNENELPVYPADTVYLTVENIWTMFMSLSIWRDRSCTHPPLVYLAS